jgi:hypothetical protein
MLYRYNIAFNGLAAHVHYKQRSKYSIRTIVKYNSNIMGRVDE